MERMLMDAIAKGDAHRKANPSKWSPDGYLMRPDSICPHCGRPGLSESAWCGLCGEPANDLGATARQDDEQGTA